MTHYEVVLTGDAERDLEDIHEYIAEVDCGRRDVQALLARRLLNG